MEDFGVLWVWEFCGNSHGFFFFCGNGMSMGIEIQFPRQPCLNHLITKCDTFISASASEVIRHAGAI